MIICIVSFIDAYIAHDYFFEEVHANPVQIFMCGIEKKLVKVTFFSSFYCLLNEVIIPLFITLPNQTQYKKESLLYRRVYKE